MHCLTENGNLEWIIARLQHNGQISFYLKYTKDFLSYNYPNYYFNSTLYMPLDPKSNIRLFFVAASYFLRPSCLHKQSSDSSSNTLSHSTNQCCSSLHQSRRWWWWGSAIKAIGLWFHMHWQNGIAKLVIVFLLWLFHFTLCHTHIKPL